MRRKILIATAAALAVAGGGAAIAASKSGSPQEESKAVVDDAAKQLGVTPAKLSSALKQALENRVDAAVAAGRLTKEQGDALKQRIEAEARDGVGRETGRAVTALGRDDRDAGGEAPDHLAVARRVDAGRRSLHASAE